MFNLDFYFLTQEISQKTLKITHPKYYIERGSESSLLEQWALGMPGRTGRIGGQMGHINSLYKSVPGHTLGARDSSGSRRRDQTR